MPITKKIFEILTASDTSKNLSRASPSPPTGQLKNLGRGFCFYTRLFRSFNIGFVDLFYLKFSSIFSKRCNLKIHETNIKRTKWTSIKGKSPSKILQLACGGQRRSPAQIFRCVTNFGDFEFFFLSWAYPGGILSNQFSSFNLKDSLSSDNSRFSDCCL